MPEFDSKAVANYLLATAKTDGETVSPMRLQKLVYYAHGWMLALKDLSLIDEQVEAWRFGPVIPSLYHEFKEFGNGEITRPAYTADWTASGTGSGLAFPEFSVAKLPDDGSPEAEFAKALLNKAWQVYKPYSAVQLSNMTHETGSPWDQVFQKYHGSIPKGTDIPRDIIRDYFRSLVGKK